MADTIELLEAIGRDALLRHASAEELGKVLEKSQASEALTAAVVFGDSSRLTQEFGQKRMDPPNSSQGLPDEDEEPDQEDGEEPLGPPAQDRGKSSLQ
jgi:hypothetical protein